ncbi:CinA family protein [Oxalobacteraceae bacterium CAVE-383]|nr:CinA family protein [Oxalobacteraceae bacterium CAVE-383]
MANLEQFSDYAKQNNLKLMTAESCTAGLVASLLGGLEGCAEWLEGGLVTYSPAEKCQLLGVNDGSIRRFGLTSEQVAQEMACGALKISSANFAIANTGVAGPESKDGIPPGTVCFAWSMSNGRSCECVSETQFFRGDREQVRKAAAAYAIDRAAYHHRRLAALIGGRDQRSAAAA